MRVSVRAVLLAACLVLPASTNAQTPSHVIVGPVLELPARTITESGGSRTLTIRGASVGVAFPLTHVSLEFFGVWHSRESSLERDDETLVSEYRLQSRDVPLVAALRFRPRCPNLWCVELVSGGGLNLSRRSAVKIGNCGPAPVPAGPCAPTNVPLIVRNKEEPTVMFGADVMFRVFDRLDLGPSLRLWYVWRYADRTRDSSAPIYQQRIPSAERIEIGVHATVRLK